MVLKNTIEAKMEEKEIPEIRQVLPFFPFIKRGDGTDEIIEFTKLFPGYSRKEYWENGIHSPEATLLKIRNYIIKKIEGSYEK